MILSYSGARRYRLLDGSGNRESSGGPFAAISKTRRRRSGNLYCANSGHNQPKPTAKCVARSAALVFTDGAPPTAARFLPGSGRSLRLGGSLGPGAVSGTVSRIPPGFQES